MFASLSIGIRNQIISKIEKVCYNKLCTLSIKILKRINFFASLYPADIFSANFFRTPVFLPITFIAGPPDSATGSAKINQKIAINFFALSGLFSQKNY
jgi:hypothetical protein